MKISHQIDAMLFISRNRAVAYNPASQNVSSRLLFGSHLQFEDFKSEFPKMDPQKQVDGLLRLWDKHEHDMCNLFAGLPSEGQAALLDRLMLVTNPFQPIERQKNQDIVSQLLHSRMWASDLANRKRLGKFIVALMQTRGADCLEGWLRKQAVNAFLCTEMVDIFGTTKQIFSEAPVLTEPLEKFLRAVFQKLSPSYLSEVVQGMYKAQGAIPITSKNKLAASALAALAGKKHRDTSTYLAILDTATLVTQEVAQKR